MPNRQTDSALGQFQSLLKVRCLIRLTDQQLLHQFLATKEEAAFARLVERHGPMVLGVCRAVLHHTQDAEDVFQATFLVLARKAVSIRKQGSLAPWLHGVAFRLALRAKAGRSKVFDRPIDTRSQASPLEELSGRELRQILHEELERLPKSYRQPLILCYLEGLTQDEAASRLGVTAATVKGRVDRGRSLLRRRLTRRGLELGLPLLVASLAERASDALSPALINQIPQGAKCFRAGTSAAGKISERAIALAEEWGRKMLTVKLKVGTVLILCGILGAGLAAFQPREANPPAAENPPATKPDEAKTAQQRTDARGDSLPEGAIVRFGSAHLRHGSSIRASALSPDGKLLATAGDNSVIVWDLKTDKALHQFHCDKGITYSYPPLEFSPDSTHLGYIRGGHFACVWDVQTGKELRRFERRFEDGLDKFWSIHCQFANDGKEFTLTSQSAIETYNLQSGELKTSVPVKRLALLSSDGKIFVRRGAGPSVSLGNAHTGEDLTELDVSVSDRGDRRMAFSPDGKALALVHDEKEIQIRDTASTKILATFLLPQSALRFVENGMKYWEYRVAFSVDSKTLLMGTSRGQIHRWDIAEAKELPPLGKHGSALVGMHILPDGRTLVSTGSDGVIRRWDLKTSKAAVEPAAYEGHNCTAYSDDGRFVAMGDGLGRVDLWDAQNGKPIRTIQKEGVAIASLAFAPDGKLLAAAERDTGTIRFWQSPSGVAGEVWEAEVPPTHHWFNRLQFSPDGRFLCISAWSQTRVVELAGRQLAWKTGHTYQMAYSPDGATLFVAPSGPYLTPFDATTGKKRPNIRLDFEASDRQEVLHEFAISPDGRQLAAVMPGGTLMLCDGHNFGRVKTLATYGDLQREVEIALRGGKMPNVVRALAFSPDSKWLASAGSDGVISIWEGATGKEVLHLAGHDGEVGTVAFSPDGRTLFSHGNDGQGYLWNPRPKRVAGPLIGLKELWTDLAGTDATRTYQAVWAFADDPQAVEFLRKKCPPAVQPDEARLAKLIADLQSDKFNDRAAASQALADLAELAAPAMEEAFKNSSSVEQRKRLEALLATLKEGMSPVQITQARAVQALELAGSPEARKALKELAGGATGARLTQDAKAAIVRLEEVDAKR